jgi:pyruvate dehydrogenase (quinone)
MMPEQARHLVDRAMQIATVERTVTCLIIPHDVQELDAVPVPARKHGALHS